MTRLTRATALLVAATALSGNAALARDLTVVSFGGALQDAQREALFKPYIAQFGPLTDEAYNGELAKIKAMVEAGDVTWDVVQMEAPELENACSDGTVERLDWDKLGGTKDIIPAAVMGDCGLGSILYSVVLAYDHAKLGEDGPTTWADFWNTEKWPGKRGLRKSAKFTLEIALLADGVAPDQVYEVLGTPEGVERAFAKLNEIKGSIQWWESGAQPPQWLAAGDVVMSSAYNGRVSTAIKEGQDFRIVWDGQVYTVDGWAIIKGTPNLDSAYDFLKITADPKNQAVLSTAIPYGTSNVNAPSLVSPEVLAWLPTAPDNMKGAVHQDDSFWIDNIEELNERFNNWASN